MIAPDAGTDSAASHRLWSLWDMFKLQIKPLLDTQDVLVQWSIHLGPNGIFAKTVPNTNKESIKLLLTEKLIPELSTSDFSMCAKGASRLLATLDRTSRPRDIASDINDLRKRLLDQADSVFCLTLSVQERELYEPAEPLFGSEVDLKSPEMSEDIAEAGKCLALQRPTAVVFHLMRVMEIAVQSFGKKVKARVDPQKDSWNDILGAINGKIRQIPRKTSRQRARSTKYAEASALLNAVRIAWRNEVMHPKQTYTQEEAETIFRSVKAFVCNSADLL